MARARNIKPGLFANEELAELPFEDRLLFIGLWTLADREGRLEDRPKRIRAQIFPYDSVDVEPMMTRLASSGFIVRYSVGTERFAQIVNFTKHQVPHHKEVASEIPAPEGCPQITRHAYDVSEKVRQDIFARDGNACLRCGSVESLSLDHITPLGSGGDNSMSNLQTLCTSCNSSKGNSTKDYRKSNVGLTLVQCKANQVASCPSDSLIPDSLVLIPDSLVLIPDSGFLIPDTREKNLPAPQAAPAAKARKPNPEAQEACRQVWAAYSEAYLSRYKAEPVRNAKVNAQVAQLVKNLGTDAAPVAAFFVWHNDAFYVRKGHDIGCAVTDAGKLRTEWITGNRVTAKQAAEADRLQGDGDDWNQIKLEHGHGNARID